MGDLIGELGNSVKKLSGIFIPDDMLDVDAKSPAKSAKDSKGDSPVLVDEDAQSTSTEVIDGEMVYSDSDKTLDTTPRSPGPLAPPAAEEDEVEEPIAVVESAAEAAESSVDTALAVTEAAMAESLPAFQLALPDELTKAMSLANGAVKEWWASLEPLLKKLVAQLQERVDPLLAPMKPHTDAAAAKLKEWQVQLEPHTSKIIAAMQKATEAARVQAYEPALAYIATATVYLQTHGKELAVLAGQKAVVGFEASKEWLKAQQPAIQQAWLATVAHSQVSIRYPVVGSQATVAHLSHLLTSHLLTSHLLTLSPLASSPLPFSPLPLPSLPGRLRSPPGVEGARRATGKGTAGDRPCQIARARRAGPKERAEDLRGSAGQLAARDRGDQGVGGSAGCQRRQARGAASQGLGTSHGKGPGVGGRAAHQDRSSP